MAETPYRGPVCQHCRGLIAARNPTGYCDHMFWPDNLTAEAKLANGIDPATPDAREQLACEIESIRMDEVLLAMGEMSAQERRNAKALLGFVANRVRRCNVSPSEKAETQGEG